MRPAVPDEVQHMRQCSRRIFLKCGLGACSASALIPPLSSRSVMPYYKAVFLRWKLGPVWFLPSSGPSDLVLWIIAPSARASAKEIAIA